MNETMVIKMLTVKEAKQLKEDLLSMVTDKNIKFIDTENNDERFGALMTMSYVFKALNKYFTDNWGI